MSELRRVEVPLGPEGYEVVVGPGARSELAPMLPETARLAAVVTQPGIGVALDLPLPSFVVEIARGEARKSLATVEELGRAFGRHGLSRSDVVIAVGGGLVTDVAGLAASLWHRGTPVVHVATTLLAQIDAAIGGKTGVNLPEGKNLMGTFHQPRGVVCDTDTLASLPEEEWRSGLGELAKYAFLGVDGLAEMSLVEQVEACVACKAGVVAADERESAGRMVLNYGHTLAHALEAAGLAGEAGGETGGPATLRHGEAVAVGLVFAARLAEALGRVDAARVGEHVALVESLGLSPVLPKGSEPARLVQFMSRDKKAHGDLTFVLDGPDGVEPVRGVEASLVRRVLEEMPSA